MRTVAMIIARGGSRRVPRKNVKPFCGLPLIAWSIIQAQCSHLVDEVWMSTDDDEIEDISTQYGATVVRRPDWPNPDALSGTVATSHLIETAIATTGDIDCIVSMLPTSPVRPPDLIDRLVARYQETGSTVIMASENREIALYERDGRELHVAVLDKDYRYFTANSGITAMNPHEYLRAAAAQSPNDDEVIVDTQRKIAEGGLPGAIYITAPLWAQHEVDTLEEFELGEILMEHYLLQGRGRTVYDEYARSKQ